LRPLIFEVLFDGLERNAFCTPVSRQCESEIESAR
jgi:hypothetical protein